MRTYEILSRYSEEKASNVTRRLYSYLYKDPSLSVYFADHVSSEMKTKFKDFLSGSVGADGDESRQYLRSIHQPLNISNEEFYYFCAYLEKALINEGVNANEAGIIMDEFSSLFPIICNDPK